MNLLAGDLRLLGPQLLLFVGGIVFAEAGAGIPARVGAHLAAATRALLEILLALDHGRFKGRVGGLAAHGLLNLVGRLDRANLRRKKAAEVTC